MSMSIDEQSLPRRAWSVRANNFLGGFASLFRSLPLSVFPPRKSLWEQTGDDIRECWQEVGDDMKAAMDAFEGELPTGRTPNVRSANSRKEGIGGAIIIEKRKETFHFSKNYEKLDPETQKLFLAFFRGVAWK